METLGDPPFVMRTRPRGAQEKKKKIYENDGRGNEKMKADKTLIRYRSMRETTWTMSILSILSKLSMLSIYQI